MWLGIDPLWEKYAGMNPYNYCAGNPVRLVDRDGREFDDEDKTYLNDKFIPKAKELKDKYQRELMRLSGNSNRVARKQETLNIKIEEVENSLREIEILMKSDQKYKFDFKGHGIPKENKNKDIFGITSYSQEEDAVLMSIKLGSNDYGTIAHELKHAYQFETGDLSFNNTKRYIAAYLYDMTDEKQAHLRGWAFESNYSRFVDSNAYPYLQNKVADFSLKNQLYRGSMINTYNISRNIEYFRYDEKTYKPNK